MAANLLVPFKVEEVLDGPAADAVAQAETYLDEVFAVAGVNAEALPNEIPLATRATQPQRTIAAEYATLYARR